MIRRKRLRSKGLRPRGPITRKGRKASEFARIYHSRARVAWVKAQPCIVCGSGPCDNAHTENGGMGRKADYDTIVPLCCMPSCDPYSPGYVRGHHGLLHQIGVETFERTYDIDLKLAAIACQQRWLAHCARVA